MDLLLPWKSIDPPTHSFSFVNNHTNLPAFFALIHPAALGVQTTPSSSTLPSSPPSPAVTQLFRLQQPGSSPNELIKVSNLGRPLGGSFICLGILFLWLGTSRYFHNQTVLSYGQFPASRGSVVLATVTVLSVLLACFIIVVLQGRTT